MTIGFGRASVCVDRWFSGAGISADLKMLLITKICSPFNGDLVWASFELPRTRDGLYRITDVMERGRVHAIGVWLAIHDGPRTVTGPIYHVDTEDHTIEIGFTSERREYPQVPNSIIPFKPADSIPNQQELFSDGSNPNEIEIGGITIYISKFGV